MADHDMIVEQDAADIGAKSYIWKYCADNSCHGEKINSKNLQRTFWVRKLTEMSTTRAVVSASSCERNWSVNGRIHSKVHNKLAPATTEKLFYVYANSNFVSKPRSSGNLIFFARTPGPSRAGPVSRLRDGGGGAEAPFLTEARGARRGSTPPHASANPGPAHNEKSDIVHDDIVPDIVYNIE
jgi:hypothetical protein